MGRKSRNWICVLISWPQRHLSTISISSHTRRSKSQAQTFKWDFFSLPNKTISSGLLSVMNSCTLVYSWDKTNSQSSSHFNAVWNWSNAYWPPTQFYFSLKSIREMRKLDGKRGKCMKKGSSSIAFTLMLTSSHKHIYIDYLYSIYVLYSHWSCLNRRSDVYPLFIIELVCPDFPHWWGFYSCRVCVCKTKLITAPRVSM